MVTLMVTGRCHGDNGDTLALPSARFYSLLDIQSLPGVEFWEGVRLAGYG